MAQTRNERCHGSADNQGSVLLQWHRPGALPGRRDKKSAKNPEGSTIRAFSQINLGGPRARGSCYLLMQALPGVRSSVDRSSDNVRDEGDWLSLAPQHRHNEISGGVLSSRAWGLGQLSSLDFVATPGVRRSVGQQRRSAYPFLSLVRAQIEPWTYDVR